MAATSCIDVKILVLQARTRTKCYSIMHDKHTLSLSHVMYRIFAVAQAGGVVPGGHS